MSSNDVGNLDLSECGGLGLRLTIPKHRVKNWTQDFLPWNSWLATPGHIGATCIRNANLNPQHKTDLASKR